MQEQKIARLARSVSVFKVFGFRVGQNTPYLVRVGTDVSVMNNAKVAEIFRLKCHESLISGPHKIKYPVCDKAGGDQRQDRRTPFGFNKIEGLACIAGF